MPHHGAATSIVPFFQAVHETVAVVSVGPNSYGHPVPGTLQALRGTGARVFRTDRSGDVVYGGRSMGPAPASAPVPKAAKKRKHRAARHHRRSSRHRTH